MPPKKYTPYISFCIQQRPLVRAEMPDLNPRQITSELGRRWRELKTNKREEKDPQDDSPSLFLCLFFYLYYVVAFSIIWHLFQREEQVFSTYRLPNPYENVYPWQLPAPVYQIERYPYIHPHTYVTLLGILFALFGG
jgi:hypothetical protein